MATQFPKCIVLTGPDEGKEVSLFDKEILSIGRSDEHDLVFSDTSVSRDHATLLLKDGTWYIRDENSRNGVQVNERSIQPGAEEKLPDLANVRIGIYEFKFLAKEKASQTTGQPVQPIGQDKEKAGAAPPVNLEENTAKEFQNKPSQDADLPNKTDTDELDDEVGALQREDLPRPKWGKSLGIFIVIAILFCLIGIGLHYFYGKPVEDENRVEEKTSQDSVPDVSDSTPDNVTPTKDVPTMATEGDPTNVQVIPVEVAVTQDVEEDQDNQNKSHEYNVFLDVGAEPLPATIFFKDERLGITPFKKNIRVEPNQNYFLYADFELRELNDIFRKKVEFTSRPDVDVIELKISAEIGLLKIQKLPRKVEFYLEGFYANDKLKANPAKITDIVYGKPIYLPYGTYTVELREKTKVSGSENEITQIRYQREYQVNAENRILDLQVTDHDLEIFPAVISSVPNHADVYYGSNKVGTTPYTGSLPLGPHKLKIVKEGYFTETIDINMNMNSVYQKTVQLKTSKIGELINEAKEKIRQGQDEEAISQMVDALKYGGSLREKSEIYFLLGDTYLKDKKYSDALPYFEKAKRHTDFSERATLGVVKCYHGLEQKEKALTSIVEVLVSLDDNSSQDIRREANEVFKKISPVKSVIYIYTDPAGAGVFVNDKKINQDTPIILSDLGLGNYRIQIEKPGYETFRTKQNLKFSDFVIVRVKLKPEKL